MNLLNIKIGTLLLLALFVSSSFMAVSPISEIMEPANMVHSTDFGSSLTESQVNLSIPYADNHYGSADGIIDPWEYSYRYTDPVSGVTAYLEHNGTAIFVGLESLTSGWIGLAWQNYTDSFSSAGLNNSDLIVGYAPSITHSSDYWRVVPTDAVSVHYILRLRDGSILQESDYPDLSSTEPVQDLAALQMYKDSIIGMRIGEIRHFVIPAEEAYTSPDHDLYGQDLVYDIELTRIYRESFAVTSNPADQSAIIYSDEHGTSTFQHVRDTDQSRIFQADGSDNGTYTQLEYAIWLNSTDINDIALFNSTDIRFPFVFMFGSNEELNGLPVQHTYWTKPAKMNLVPNVPPELVIESPKQDEVVGWVASLKLKATDDFVQRAVYKVDNEENWVNLTYNFESKLWEANADMTSYDEGPHTITFNASDPSGFSAIATVNIVVDIPYTPLLGMKVDATRSLITTEHFGSRVIDEYTVINNGSAPISSIDIFLPDRYTGNFLSMEASDSDDNQVLVIRMADSNGMLRWRLYFNEPVGFQESYSFETTMYMTSLFWLTDSTEWEYRLEFLKYPLLSSVIRRARFSLSFEEGGSLIPGETIPDSDESNIVPFTESEFGVYLRIFGNNVVADRKTTIVVDAWGWLDYKETITLDNAGAGSLNTITFTVPAYATNMIIYDEVGLLAQSQQTAATGNFNETNNIVVNLLADRFGLGLKSSFKYKFQVEYVVQASSYQESVANGNKLTPPMALLSDVLVRKHTIDVVMPVSVSLVEASGVFRSIYGVFDTTLRYLSYNTTRRNPASIELVYQITIGAAARPAIFALMIGVIGLIYVTRRKVELPEEVTGPRVKDEFDDSKPRQVGAPSELLSEFANLYSRKTALNMDLEKLDAARRRGKVKKREYMIRERDLKQQIDEIDSSLPSLRDDMISYGPRYRDLVAQLELQDERIEGAKAGLRQLLLRKKKQRISRAAFEKSRQDYLKTIQKATTATDRILLAIQEEAGDI
ncbi:MAG: FKBP-type peptidyl-prolyl cis-trans isomerase [Candidatus Thorarchaeota archaeon]